MNRINLLNYSFFSFRLEKIFFLFEGMKFFVLDTKYDKYFGLSSKARHGKKLSGFEPDRALGFELGLFFVGKTKLNQSH